MNIKYLLILFLGFTAFAYAQDRTQNLGDFNEIKVFNGLSVEIERTDNSKVDISGEKTDDVVIKNVNGKLKFSLKFPEQFNADKVKIKIFYSQDVLILDANEGSAIFSDEMIDQVNLTIKTQEGAYIHVPVDVEIAPDIEHPEKKMSYAQLWASFDKSKENLKPIKFTF